MSEARSKKNQAARVLAKPQNAANSKAATPKKISTKNAAAKDAAAKNAATRRRASKDAPSDLELAAAALDAIDSQAPPSICVSIPSSAEYVRVVRLALLGVASRMPFSYDDVEDIKLAVAEACNNAIVHGDGEAQIKVLLTPYSDRLEIEVTDGGRVMLPQIVSPREKPAAGEELRESGLGLFLMRNLMDKAEYHAGLDSDTRVHLVKYLPGSARRKSAA